MHWSVFFSMEDRNLRLTISVEFGDKAAQSRQGLQAVTLEGPDDFSLQ